MTTTPTRDTRDGGQPTAPSASASSWEGLSPRELLEAAADAVRVRRLAEVAELELAAGWAGMHSTPRASVGGRADPMVTPGGDGTPEVREYALPELGIARSTHHSTTRSLVADVLDLQHRLPKTWQIVQAGGCEVWVARKAAVLSRHLPFDKIVVVDTAVAKVIGGHPPSSVLEVAQAAIIKADPEAHAARKEAERRERYVKLSRTDELGYRHVIARITAGDAAWIDAMVQRVADILAQTHGADHHINELRSMAFGWLARPADLLKLLLDHTSTHRPHRHPPRLTRGRSGLRTVRSSVASRQREARSYHARRASE